MKHFLLSLVLLLSGYYLFAQTDSTLSLRIIDEKVVVNKEKLQVNFSYFYENNTSNDIALIDYYSPCFWETLVHDSTKSHFIVLEILDDSGKVVMPENVQDSTKAVGLSHSDSLHFYEKFEKNEFYEYQFHTRVLRPKDVLINLFIMKLNKRKCFNTKRYVFDFSRNYYVSLYYLAKDDIQHYMNRSELRPHDEVFMGKIQSNKVPLIFK